MGARPVGTLVTGSSDGTLQLWGRKAATWTAGPAEKP